MSTPQGPPPSTNEAVEHARGWLADRGLATPHENAAPQARTDGDVTTVRTLPGVDDGDPDADPETVARTIVVRKLSLRAHTRAELEQALQARQVPAAATSAVLDRMTELGLIDDEAFARDWVESRQQRRHLSRRGLRQELARRGVERGTIDTALMAVDGEDELAAARALVDKKRAALERLDPKVRYRRLAGLLGRRGYSSAVVATVLDETLRPISGELGRVGSVE